MIPVALSTQRLVLDLPVPDDRDLVTEYCQDPVFETFMTLPWPYRPEHATFFLEAIVPQGWANDGADLVQPTSSILKRKRGAATLTIFVKPENGGSEVKMFTEGLAWE